MIGPKRRIVLSRFFSDNVKCVANMCPRCYEECLDVRIVSVNLIFLEQVKYDIKNVFSHTPITSPDTCMVKSDNKECFGFTQQEIGQALERSRKIKEIINTKRPIAETKKVEVTYCQDLKSTESVCDDFKGFPLSVIENSFEYHEKFINKCDQIRLKIYKQISLRVWKNIYRRKRLKKRPKCLKILTTPNGESPKGYLTPISNESKYFTSDNKDSSNNNSITFRIKTNILQSNNIHIKEEHTDKMCFQICNSKSEHSVVNYEAEYFKLLQRNRGIPITIDCRQDFSQMVPKKEEIDIEFQGQESKIKYSWVPPKSPHNLIEEHLYHDPWALLVATIFLNRTTCMCARPYIFWFLFENPDPLRVLEKLPEDLEKYFTKLGLQKTRSVQVWRMSHDFIYKCWKNVGELYGIGQYGENAFRMFCLGDFNVEPKDRFLRIYKAWYEKVKMGGTPICAEVCVKTEL